MRFSGTVWRHVPREAQPVHLGFILRAKGRWNREGDYACIYTSLSPEGARAEYLKYLGTVSGKLIRRRKHELVSIEVTVEPVIDLTDPAAPPVPVDSPFLTGDAPEDLELCLNLADWLRAQGYAGLIAPSAALKGAKNLDIYIDGPARNLTLKDGGKRIPL